MPLRNFLLLLLAALIWGTAFVGQAIGINYVPPFTFTAGRSLIGFAALLPFALIRMRGLSAASARARKPNEFAALRRNTLVGGIVCGTALFIAESFQQFSLIYTPVGKAGFITALYIIFVPIIALLFLGRKSTRLLWVAVLVAIAGLYFLSVKDGLNFNPGDVLCFVCAICYALQILSVDKYARNADAVSLSCIMFLTGGILGIITTVLFEPGLTLDNCLKALPAMLYVGVLSNGVAYTCQVLGQKGANPTIASLTMSLESPFAAISGWIALDQILSGREIFGCVLMGMAIILAQLPDRKRSGK